MLKEKIKSLEKQILAAAEESVQHYHGLGKSGLDFTLNSVSVIEQLLAELQSQNGQMSTQDLDDAVNRLGSYVLEMGRQNFGGHIYWFDSLQQPILIVGEPQFRISFMPLDRIRAHIEGSYNENFMEYYQEFLSRVQQAKVRSEMYSN